MRIRPRSPGGPIRARPPITATSMAEYRHLAFAYVVDGAKIEVFSVGPFIIAEAPVIYQPQGLCSLDEQNAWRSGPEGSRSRPRPFRFSQLAARRMAAELAMTLIG